MHITRRDALKAMGLAGAGLLAGGCRITPNNGGAYGKWWRGNLHMHTYWSDGRVFPEQAVDIYKNKLGYDFLAMSDHNGFADNADHWKPVLAKEGKWPPDVTTPYFNVYMNSAFGKDAQTRATTDGQTEVRLRPYNEVKTMFEEPGRFLLMPGVEITQVTDGINVHLNYVNLPEVVPSVKGIPPIYGTGSDDTHYYFDLQDKKAGRVGVDYIVVRSATLTPAALLAAMHAGDFYTSTGVTLDDIAFDTAKRRLSVRVQPAPDASYTIRFVTTKKNFDQTVRTVEVPAAKGHGSRTVPIYSEDIGKTVKLVEGTEAAYTMAADDLYVRAKIESSQASLFNAHFHPSVKVAWTQPYGA